jgi:uncharacterized glyoxalase superfamily protein PhnB
MADLTGTSLIPALRYRDVVQAIEWLCAAFGFEKRHVVTAEDGGIVYAHLTLGGAMVLVRSIGESALDRVMKQPDEIGGAETQSCYLVVTDADVHCRRAKAAGADILLDVDDDDHGGRGYTCRDPEGHVWSFGTYDPWPGKPLSQHAGPVLATPRRAVALSALLACLALGATAGWMLSGGDEARLKQEASTARVRAEQGEVRANQLADGGDGYAVARPLKPPPRSGEDQFKGILACALFRQWGGSRWKLCRRSRHLHPTAGCRPAGRAQQKRAGPKADP